MKLSLSQHFIVIIRSAIAHWLAVWFVYQEEQRERQTHANTQ